MTKSSDEVKLEYFLNIQSFNLQDKNFSLILQLWTMSKKLLILNVFFSTLWKETKSFPGM